MVKVKSKQMKWFIQDHVASREKLMYKPGNLAPEPVTLTIILYCANNSFFSYYLLALCVASIPDQGSNLHTMHWQHRF